MQELKSIEEVDAALAAGKIRTLGDLVQAWPQAAFDLGLEDDLPPAGPAGGSTLTTQSAKYRHEP
jgi:hypothetical protein